MTGSCGGCVERGPSIGAAGERAKDRAPCSSFGTIAYKGGLAGPVGLKNGKAQPGDWAVNGYLGMGGAFGVSCGRTGHVPGFAT